ncbi:hypothetical protein [Mycobacterium shigaense]|uniref:Uncharacterized protein n=1 Tax=Mycobacterium shigaense TaxID=722731 RepID=A0A1Z4EN29_9MYCO|nr:hypothetical protein [Mycobacterium shigaense]MEA1120594.1 hypothetical protein [Mycobacterium shigaense]PRI14185.1 hypothetical protein B2J96_15800 [Mycobacterium shigaense]BAX94331.1 hypothetical protein MSG_04210 [Mycobacterium shigaense]
MKPLLLSVHVLAGILFVGPVAVATSLFPRYAPAPNGPAGGQLAEPDMGTARLLHRITRVYGTLALVVPIVGLMLAVVQGRATEVWIIVAMVLTAFAGGLLALQISPRQRDVLAHPDAGALGGLRMMTGIFNLLWAAVVVLMVVRPGSRYA